MKHLVFVMMMCVSAGVHAISAGGHGGGGHASGHASSHASSHASGHVSSAGSASVPHIYSTGHPSFGRPMRVTNSFYHSYGFPVVSIPNFHEDDKCDPPKVCRYSDVRNW